MKKIITIGLLVGLLGSAYAEYKPYVSANAGVATVFNKDSDTKYAFSRTRIKSTVNSVTDESLDADIGTGYSTGLAIGLREKNHSIEAEVSYQENDFKDIGTGDGNLSQTSIMLNGRYFYVNDTPISPYVLGGAGVSVVNVRINDVNITQPLINDYKFDKSDTVLAIKLGVGTEIEITENVGVDLNIVYRATTNYEMASDDGYVVVESENDGINYNIGINYKF
jgi:opacity protein-like surface antigen